MKKDNAAAGGETEILSFEDVRKAIDPKKKAVSDAMAKRKNLIEGIERYRDETILIDGNICGLQDKLNNELTTDGKASQKTLDTLAVLRHKYEDLENTIMGLKMSALPKIDEEIRLAQIEMNQALELALDQLRPIYLARINSRYTGIDMDCEEWLNGVQSVLNEYGVSLGSIDKMRVLRLKGIKPNSDLIIRLT